MSFQWHMVTFIFVSSFWGAMCVIQFRVVDFEAARRKVHTSAKGEKLQQEMRSSLWTIPTRALDQLPYNIRRPRPMQGGARKGRRWKKRAPLPTGHVTTTTTTRTTTTTTTTTTRRRTITRTTRSSSTVWPSERRFSVLFLGFQKQR